MSLEKPLILLIEDEKLIALGLEMELTDAGFTVILATSGPEAQDHLDENTERFACLVTDIRLPGGVDGWTLARNARDRVHALPVVYMSGDSAADWAVYGVPNSIVLAKPFAMAQLTAAVTQLINSQPRF